MPLRFDTVLISDVHFGSPLCQAEILADFLANLRVKRLILNGDIFEDLKFYRLPHWHWEAFGRIRKVSDHCEVIWIRGNHDRIDAEFLSHLLGVRVVNHYAWGVGGLRLHAVHGDRWDAYIHRYRLANELVTGAYNVLRSIHTGAMRRVTKWVKRSSKILLRNHEALLANATDYAREHALDAIFCGHTHRAWLGRRGGVVYGNSGTWESDLPHFLGVLGGEVSLHRYEGGGRAATIAAETLRSDPPPGVDLVAATAGGAAATADVAIADVAITDAPGVPVPPGAAPV